MEIKDFLKDFEQQFEEVRPGQIRPDTELESLDEWSSLQVLAIIGMADSKYQVRLTGTELNNAKTVKDIYELVNNKLDQK